MKLRRLRFGIVSFPIGRPSASMLQTPAPVKCAGGNRELPVNNAASGLNGRASSASGQEANGVTTPNSAAFHDIRLDASARKFSEVPKILHVLSGDCAEDTGVERQIGLGQGRVDATRTWDR